MVAFADSSGNGYDITLGNTADWTVSSGGLPNGHNYVYGDGSIAASSNANGDDFNLADGTAWTVECWMFLGATLANYEILAIVADAGTTTYAWALYVDPSEQLQFDMANTSAALYLGCTSGTLATSTWYHVVGTKGTGAELKLYLNGTLVATDTSTTGTARTPTSSYRLYVGTHGNATLPMTTNGSRISKLAIYNRLLSVGEIAEHRWNMTAT